MSKSGFEAADAHLRALYPSHSPSQMLIGLEFGGHHGFTFARFLADRGYPAVNVLPAHTSRAKELEDNNPLKTDAKDAANTRALALLLAGWHAYPREVELGLPFIMDEPTLRAASVLTLTTDRGLLDLFREMKGVGSYDRALRDSVTITLDGGTVHTLSLEQLIAVKRAAGRPKDREHLLELEALRELQRKGSR